MLWPLLILGFRLYEAFCDRLTFFAKLDTSYCWKPCCWRVFLAQWYISAVISSVGMVTCPEATCLNNWVPRSRVSWYRDTWSSQTLSNSDNSLPHNSSVCLGRPNMISTDTPPGHNILASSRVCKASRELWSRPKLFRSSSCKDCGNNSVIS